MASQEPGISFLGTSGITNPRPASALWVMVVDLVFLYMTAGQVCTELCKQGLQ